MNVGEPVKLSAEEAAESPAPPFHSAQTTSCEVCRPVWSWLTLTRAVVDFHSCSINFPGPCSGSFPTFVSFVTVAWGLNLIHFGYVYCWSCSRLYYSKLLGLLPEASLLPSQYHGTSSQNTKYFKSNNCTRSLLASAFLLQETPVDGGSSLVGGPSKTLHD